jgi:hypothetical protein
MIFALNSIAAKHYDKEDLRILDSKNYVGAIAPS